MKYFVTWVDAIGNFQNEVVETHPVKWFTEVQKGRLQKQRLPHSTLVWWAELPGEKNWDSEWVDVSGREADEQISTVGSALAVVEKRKRGRPKKQP